MPPNSVSGHFIVQPSDTFVLPTDRFDHDYFNLSLGVSAQFTNGASGFINYRQVLGYDELETFRIDAGIRIGF